MTITQFICTCKPDNTEINSIITLTTLIFSILLAVWNYFQLKKIENLKTELQKRLNVHKLQFEKEFEIYKELCVQLNKLRYNLAGLRPQADHYAKNMTYEEAISARIKEAAIEGRKLIDLTETNRPFYAEDIYQQLKEINKLIKFEIIEVTYGDKIEAEYWKEGIKTTEKYINLTEKIYDSIRKRIGNMNEI
jgi:ribosomal protein L16 Arg81 hydroxylase